MQLILIRHAIAKPRNTRRWRDDGDRPLSRLGTRRFSLAARALRRSLDRPAKLFCSPLVRARQTAALLTGEAGWPEAEILESLAPGVKLSRLLEALALMEAERVVLVGHEPGLGLLATALIGGVAGRGTTARTRSAVEFKKGAVASLRFAGAALPGRGQLEWLLPPRVLRSLGARGRHVERDRSAARDGGAAHGKRPVRSDRTARGDKE